MGTDFHDDLLQDYSEAELLHHLRASPRHASCPRIYLLSATLLAKVYAPDSTKDVIKTTEVARQLGIRAPCIKRTIVYEGAAFCVMERIQGATLEEMWTKLSWFMTIKLAFQLRHFVNLLRSMTSSTAGSLASGECLSFWLEDRYRLPARSRPEDIAYFIEFWMNFVSFRREIEAAKQVSAVAKRHIVPVPRTLVLTHHDLAPRNLMVDPSGQLWLIDWDYAGFYPIYFEYASLQNFHTPKDWGLFTRLRWYLFSWIAIGRYEQDARVLERIRYKFTRFAVGRRFELLAKGGPTRFPVS
ncbi:kinase-like protein [Lophiostoma macrostomum CBS 122681]|uniref:Kinase-like protein n=1 Tax=Lophiostoma macrostomum CBS 122681 TaxID=1314788 RepID=A0A6A6SKT2_9PLEO|nr:kinase-like protein [Lophiostoma macrostomum CBS 122681]